MKIILCYPPKIDYPGYGQGTRWLPLGIASIGAYIKSIHPNIDIVLLDLFEKTAEEAYREISSQISVCDINIIGFTLFTEQRFSAIKLCKSLKYNFENSISRKAEIITVVGGPHAFIMSQQIADYYPFIDHIVRGEGEKAFLQLVESYIYGEDITRIIEADNISDLSELPHSIDGFDLFKELPEMTEAPIVFSRGCTDSCTFCSTTKFWKGYRSRGAPDVYHEMCKYYNQYDIKDFKFHDDACTASVEELKLLCIMIIKHPSHNWKYEITARADQFDDELIKLLALSGCVKVSVGIESGNEALRKSMNKRLDINIAKINMKKLMDSGITVNLLFIVGYPGETDDTINETVKLIREIKPTMTCKQPLMIFPGTKVYSDLVKQEWISDDYWLTDQPQPYYFKESNWNKMNTWTKKINSASRKLKILLCVPARQTEEKFKLHVESLNKLEIPDYVSLQRIFLLHNNDNLKKFLKPSDVLYGLHTAEEYITTENTHHWKAQNLATITAMKNMIVNLVEKDDYDYIFWVDSDLIVRPETLKSLIESGKDIISEIFWTDWERSGIEEPNCWDIDHYSFFERSKEKYRIPGIYECGGTGACILVHKSVYDKGVNYNNVGNISFWGEDRHFCIRAVVAGFNIWVDTKYPAKHLYRDSDIDKKEGV